jgi:SAM-dependent methyltransferase
MTAPKRLNIGSGKDFQADFLNIDINDHWAPDIVADVSGEFPAASAYPTVRFGEVVIEPGTFDQIIANDVLEHVGDLVRTMTNCLNLLRVGGTFDINVPYDLSWGAWQDPTHVRAFNERSWLYYTDWFWYLGWSEARFVVRQSEYVVSPLGQELANRGAPIDAIATAPRAVDSMRVRLEKILLDDADRLVLGDMEAQRLARHAARKAAARS